ncbi:hypothetical protein Pmani_015189 [Petrolisthes manimaculis]|nr:hypothetical protein Pmani_015189 [Petrolisthes manimaculis]
MEQMVPIRMKLQQHLPCQRFPGYQNGPNVTKGNLHIIGGELNVATVNVSREEYHVEDYVVQKACNRCHCYQNHSRCTDDVCSKGDEMDNEKKKPHHHHLKSIYFRKSFKLPFGHEPNRSRKPETRTLGGR